VFTQLYKIKKHYAKFLEKTGQNFVKIFQRADKKFPGIRTPKTSPFFARSSFE